MMRAISLAALLLASTVPAAAEIGTLDNVPAATLLVPYFEVDLATDPTGPVTIFAVANASATSVLAQVTLWADRGVPTFAFDLYLTGYDVEYVDLRLLFEGIRPVTADAGSDPSDVVSHLGAFSDPEVDFPGLVAPCTTPLFTRLDEATTSALRQAHTGQPSSLLGGGCGGTDLGDGVARGFVTVDVVQQCSSDFPATPGYFGTVAAFDNVLFGQWWIVDRGNDFAYGDPAVAIEASTDDPRTDGVGTDYTFYGRLVGGSGADHREGLATTWMGRYADGGAFTDGTAAFVWRDAWPAMAFICNSPPSGLTQGPVVPFDEQENPLFLPFVADRFPRAAQRVQLGSAQVPLPVPFGFLYLDLNRGTPALPFGTTNQAWVVNELGATGRFAGALPEWPLDNVSQMAPFTLALPACADGVDNDTDMLVDYPDDPGCTSLADDSELN